MAMLALMTMTPAAALPSAPPPDAVEQEIVVIASKLKDWRASLVESRGDLRCYTRRSTGDAAIDRIGCTAMIRCHKQFEADFARLKDHRLPSNARNKMRKALLRDRFSPCVFEARDTMVAELADRRAAAR
ncbi:hypothetical protein ATE62_07415 [Sphingopyxis sp. HIX]|nr:hypothetical protein ATE62_07415 [Sphingopyxis sp. HIX]KTE83928.1 hypothetical protein ATE72_11270 [Sphingopyxis sp. HXXIV]